MLLHRVGILVALFCVTWLSALALAQPSKGKSEEQQARDALKKAEDVASKARASLDKIIAKIQPKAEQARKEANTEKQQWEQKQKQLVKAKNPKEREKLQKEVAKAEQEYRKADARADELERDVKQAQQTYQVRQNDVRLAQQALNLIVTAAKKKPDPPTPLPVAKLPITGVGVPELAAFDTALLKFMGERSIPGGVLAVTKKGQLVLLHGYGHSDPAKKFPLPQDAHMRLAGLTRPITAAAVHKLIKDGKLKAEDKITDLLALTPPAGQTLEARWKAITIQHLLDHQGGWDSEAGFDPLMESAKISKALGKDGPATAQDIIGYASGQPLQFEPGSKSVTSGVGYLLLGRAIEKASSKGYGEYVRDDLLKPLGIKSVEQGKSLPKNRHVREPAYFDSGKGPNVVQPTKAGDVPAPDGTFYLEAMDSAAGLIGSAVDYARFMQSYQSSGQRRDSANADGEVQGSLPGSRTLALWHGDVCLVVLFNQRSDLSGLPYDAIAEVMRKTADGIKSWPR